MNIFPLLLFFYLSNGLITAELINESQYDIWAGNDISFYSFQDWRWTLQRAAEFQYSGCLKREAIKIIDQAISKSTPADFHE